MTDTIGKIKIKTESGYENVIPRLADRASKDADGNSIKDTYATQTALTDGLAVKQDKLTAGDNITIEDGTISATANIYIATYGTTTHAEIASAVSAGKTVFVDDSGRIYSARTISSSSGLVYVFVSPPLSADDAWMQVTLDPNTGWSRGITSANAQIAIFGTTKGSTVYGWLTSNKAVVAYNGDTYFADLSVYRDTSDSVLKQCTWYGLIGTDGKRPWVQLNLQTDNWLSGTDAVDVLQQLTTAEIKAIDSGITSDKVSTYDGYATSIAGKTAVSVSDTGTATDVVNYITVDGTEKKIGDYDKNATTLDVCANGSQGYPYGRIRCGGEMDGITPATLTAVKSADGVNTYWTATAGYTTGFPAYQYNATGNDMIVVNKRLTDYAQPKLTAGDNITITDNVISATGGDGKLYVCTYGTTTVAEVNTALSAGKIPVVKVTGTYGGIYIWNSYGGDDMPWHWFRAPGKPEYVASLGDGESTSSSYWSAHQSADISDPSDYGISSQTVATYYQRKLTAGTGITITDNVIASTGGHSPVYKGAYSTKADLIGGTPDWSQAGAFASGGTAYYYSLPEGGDQTDNSVVYFIPLDLYETGTAINPIINWKFSDDDFLAYNGATITISMYGWTPESGMTAGADILYVETNDGATGSYFINATPFSKDEGSGHYTGLGEGTGTYILTNSDGTSTVTFVITNAQVTPTSGTGVSGEAGDWASVTSDGTVTNNGTYEYDTTNGWVQTYAKEDVATVYRFKGTVQNKSDLPEDGNVIGDVWNVDGDGGMNYAWMEDGWDALGGTVDLSGKQDKLTAGTGITIANNVISVSPSKATVTLSSSGWSSSTQTVSTGLTWTDSDVIMVDATPSTKSIALDAGVYASAEDGTAGTITFTCSTVPTADVTISVVKM